MLIPESLPTLNSACHVCKRVHPMATMQGSQILMNHDLEEQIDPKACKDQTFT